MRMTAANAMRRTQITSLHEEIIRSGYKLQSSSTDEVRFSGDLAYVRQTLKGGDATTHVMLVLRREPGRGWLVQAEAEEAA